MTLGEKQKEFARCLTLLLVKMHQDGYDTTIGDVQRPMDADYGHPRSTHKYKLAADINLFKDGVYLSDTGSHGKFGEFWESLHPLARWGGHFGDGNHYSFEHEGVR